MLPRAQLLAWSLAGCLALAATPRAAADSWYEAYDRAEQALGREQWSAAVAQLNTALAEKPGSGANLRTYGMRFVDYFPYLKLGIAYYHLGQTDAALAAFETEERQGAIARSATAQAQLRDYRGRIERRRAEEEASRQTRAQAILADNLAQARRLEQEGRLDDALAALGRALAVSPENPEASEARRRLLARIAEQVRAQQVRAQELAGAGQLAAAQPEPPTNRDPGSREAAAMADRRQERQETEIANQAAGAPPGALAPLLAAAAQHLAAGEHEQALAAANRVLVLEPANKTALQLLAQAYARLSDSLLAGDGTPPTILLDVEAPEGGVLATRTPDLELVGTVYGTSPVALSVLAGGRELDPPTLTARELQGVWITTFGWQHRLPPGLNRLTFVAVDRLGNRAQLDYAIEYTVPFTRSIGFPLAIAAGCAALLGGWQLARLRRRHRRLQDRFNPYVAGAPIFEPARFFGRQQLLDYVLRRISNNSIMLYGERRIGKTSFQHQLKRCLAGLDDPDHEFYPVYIDLQGTAQERFFATLAAEVFHELAPKLEGLQPPAALNRGSYGYSDFVQDLHRLLAALKARGKKKVKLVLLIDEVDELNSYDPRINQRLRSLFMRAFADNLVAVVSGVGIKKQWQREGSPWYNFFQEIEVKPFDPEEARTLIEAPVKGMFSFEVGVTDEIVRRTGAKPYLIQRLCSGLVDRMHEEGRRTITRADLEAACQVEGL